MMKYNKIIKNNETNKNTFLVACVCSILLLLMLCYFGINSNLKGTAAASTEFDYYFLKPTVTVSGCTETSYSNCSGVSNYEESNVCWYCPSRTVTRSCYKKDSDTGVYYYWRENALFGEELVNDTYCELYATNGDKVLTDDEEYVMLAAGVGISNESCTRTEYSNCSGLSNYTERNKCWACPSSSGGDVDCWGCTLGGKYMWSDLTPSSSTCTGGWHIAANTSNCESVAPSYSCYRFKATGDYYYYITSPGENYEQVDISYCDGNNSYSIKYNLFGGTVDGTNPTQGEYDEQLEIINPTKTITAVGHENDTGATIGASTSQVQTFKGWSFNTTGDASSAQSGVATGNTISWSSWSTGEVRSSFKYFKNLDITNGATATMTANWTSVSFTLPTVLKTGYNCTWNTKDDGTGKSYISGGTYSPVIDANSVLDLFAICDENTTSELITPTLEVEHQIDLNVSENKTVTYTYNGDGNVSCLVSDTTVATCSINTSSKQVTITGKKAGRAVLTLSATEGTSYSAKSVVSDINVSAITYTVSYNANGGSGAPAAQTFTSGNTLTLSSTKPSKNNCSFTKWNTNADGSGTNYNPGGSYSTKKDVTLYAQWDCEDSSGSDEPTIYTYTATFDENNGTLNGKDTLSCTSSVSNKCTLDKTFAIPTATRDGYTFKGWGDNKSCTSGKTVDLVMTTTKVTYYACWVANSTSVTSYKVTYNGNGGTVTRNSDVVESGETITLPSASQSGYTFKGWYTTASGSQKVGIAGETYTPTKDVTLYAQWTKNTVTPTSKTFTVTFNPNGGSLSGGNSDMCTTTSTSCDITDLPTASKSGYTFKGWGDNKSCTSGETNKLTLTDNITYYACYTKNAVDDNNVSDNPQTGEIVIAFVWFAGIFAISYSVYYFRKIKQN